MSIAEKSKLVVNYLLENRGVFSETEVERIIDCSYYYRDEDGIPNYNELLQLYDELGLLPDPLNPYKAFAEFLDEQFDIKNKHVVEIGGGNIPRLGKRIAQIQDRGTITVYDPNLYIKNYGYPNMKLIKRKFFPITNVDDADVLVGLLPCGSSSSIIKSALKHDKDFMIALCDKCNRLEYFDGYDEDPDWPLNFIEQTSEAVENANLGKLKVKHINEVGKQYPIIYNVRG